LGPRAVVKKICFSPLHSPTKRGPDFYLDRVFFGVRGGLLFGHGTNKEGGPLLGVGGLISLGRGLGMILRSSKGFKPPMMLVSPHHLFRSGFFLRLLPPGLENRHPSGENNAWNSFFGDDFTHYYHYLLPVIILYISCTLRRPTFSPQTPFRPLPPRLAPGDRSTHARAHATEGPRGGARGGPRDYLPPAGGRSRSFQ